MTVCDEGGSDLVCDGVLAERENAVSGDPRVLFVASEDGDVWIIIYVVDGENYEPFDDYYLALSEVE